MDADFLYAVVKDKIQGILPSVQIISPDDELVSLGFNSLTTIQLLIELELELDITFPDDELLMENFETPAQIVQMIQKQQQ